MNKKWCFVLIFLPPVFFLFNLIGVIFYKSIQYNINEVEVLKSISDNISLVLFNSQVMMLFLLIVIIRKENLSIYSFFNHIQFKEVFQGLLLGAFIAILYFGWLEEWIQVIFSNPDIVSGTDKSESFKNNLSFFFVANVVLAPFTEEVIYRWCLLKYMANKWGNFRAILFSSCAFGLLHWMGGFTYIIVTGMLIGVTFSIIQLKRKSITLVFTAHLVLNIIEYLILI